MWAHARQQVLVAEAWALCQKPVTASMRYHSSFGLGLPKVRIDGRRTVQDVIKEVEEASLGYTQAVEFMASGQPGIASAFHVAAVLRSATRAPALELADSATAKQFVHGVAGSPAVTRNITEKEVVPSSLRGKVYNLALPPAELWKPEVQRRIDARLLVSNHTKIVGLAKSVATRTASIQEGKGVAVETILLGDEKLRRLRISIIAQALVRAYHWQVLPNDKSRPTRPFKCVVDIRKDEATVASPGRNLDCHVLSVEVLPHGPPVHWAGG